MLTLILLLLLGCLALVVAWVLFCCVVEAMPLVVGLLCCWWLFHAVGCL